MTCFTPSRDPGDAERTLARIVRPHIDPLLFVSRIQQLQRMFSAYKNFCPPPWPNPGLHITSEITYQSEHWLPLAPLSHHFHALYRQVLTYPPILSSTPFAHRTSWAAVVASFPEFLVPYGNPAALLEQLVGDDRLRLRFLFWSFMPERFYGGGSNRYPAQSTAIAEWLRLRNRHGKKLRCLDAACGDGAATYGLALLCAQNGWPPASLEIEGWTLEPLEAWVAAHGRFPHDPAREAEFRDEARKCFEQGFDSRIRFCCVDITDADTQESFDLILCNGLLGGPLINIRADMEAVVSNLAALLAPGGVLLAADHFHGGWKLRCPQQELRALCERYGLKPVYTGEGIAALAPQTG
jgi:SAM-dependent methyltransferase